VRGEGDEAEVAREQLGRDADFTAQAEAYQDRWRMGNGNVVSGTTTAFLWTCGPSGAWQPADDGIRPS